MHEPERAPMGLARIGSVDGFIRPETPTWHPIEIGEDRAAEMIKRWESERLASMTRRVLRIGKAAARRLTAR